MSEPIIEVINIQKSFKTGDRQELLVLNNINIKMYEGEIVAILGKSGSGKSTLMRIIAGLIEPSSGSVNYRGKPITGPRHFYGIPDVCTLALVDCAAKCRAGS
jgi:NitT/TauT family transport system ATP-binding protein